MNLIEMSRTARARATIIPAFTETALPQTKAAPGPDPFTHHSEQSCFTCNNYDGEGPAWPGLCRYFETIGQAAKEIDFNVVDPLRGCKCYKSAPLSLVAESKRIKLHGDDPEWIPLDPSRQSVKREATRKKPSPIALAWLKDHRQALRRNGWTIAELYRRNKLKGIAWVAFWDKPFLKVYLRLGGVIEFECVINGRDIIQKATPLKTILRSQI